MAKWPNDQMPSGCLPPLPLLYAACLNGAWTGPIKVRQLQLARQFAEKLTKRATQRAQMKNKTNS